MKIYVVFISIFVANALGEYTVKWYSITDIKDVDGLKELFEDFGKELIGDDIYKVIKAVEKLSKLLPYVGPVVKVISGFLSTLDGKTDDPTLVKLTEMDNKLTKIIDKFDDIVKKFEGITVVNTYKQQIKVVDDIQNNYKRFLDSPNNITKLDLKSHCDKTPMIDFVNWVQNELSRDTMQSIRHMIMQDYNEKTVIQWSQLLVANVGQSIFLHSVCLGLKYEGDASFKTQLDNDSKKFQDKLESIKNEIKIITNELRRDFWQKKTLKEIDEFLQNEKGMSDQQITNKMHDMLSQKYPFRNWIVIANTHKDMGKDKFDWNGNGKYNKKYDLSGRRRLFVGSTSNAPRSYDFKGNFYWPKGESNRYYAPWPIVMVNGRQKKCETVLKRPKEEKRFAEKYTKSFMDCLEKFGLNPAAVGLIFVDPRDSIEFDENEISGKSNGLDVIGSFNLKRGGHQTGTYQVFVIDSDPE